MRIECKVSPKLISGLRTLVSSSIYQFIVKNDIVPFMVICYVIRILPALTCMGEYVLLNRKLVVLNTKSHIAIWKCLETTSWLLQLLQSSTKEINKTSLSSRTF